MENENDYYSLYKILLLGDQSVGKSSIILRSSTNEFKENMQPTIGVDFKMKTVEAQGRRIKMQIWDTAGQEKFMGITSSFYKGCHGILLVYDITSLQSFRNLTYWLNEISKQASADVVKILIGNKQDLNDERQVQIERASDFAELNEMNYLECSAKTGANIEKSFNLLSEMLIEKYQSDNLEWIGKSVTLNQRKNNNSNNYCCGYF